MKTVYSSNSLASVHRVRMLLEETGIRCVVTNERLGALAGEVPTFDVWPKLQVDDGDYEPALAKVNEFTAEAESEPAGEPWICPKCGESLEAQFTECWSCGAAKETQ